MTPNWQVDLTAPPYVGPVAGLIAIVDTAYSPPRALAFVAPSLKAEAQLMASARELLAACKAAAEQFATLDDAGELTETDCEAWQFVKDAIAKATREP